MVFLRSFLGFVMLLLLSSACTDDETAIRELLDQRQLFIKAKLLQLKIIATEDQKLTSDTVQIKFPESLPKLKLFKQKILPSANTAVIHERNLGALSKPVFLFVEPMTKKEKVRKKLLKSYRICPQKNVVNTAFSLFQDQKFPLSEKAPELSDYREAFKALDQLKYVIVVHHLEWNEPTLLENNGFTKGDYAGYVTVFDLENSNCIGSFNFGAESSSEIKSYTINNQSLSYYHLMKDYLINIQQAFKGKLRKNVGSVK